MRAHTHTHTHKLSQSAPGFPFNLPSLSSLDSPVAHSCFQSSSFLLTSSSTVAACQVGFQDSQPRTPPVITHAEVIQAEMLKLVLSRNGKNPLETSCQQTESNQQMLISCSLSQFPVLLKMSSLYSLGYTVNKQINKWSHAASVCILPLLIHMHRIHSPISSLHTLLC